MADARHSIAIVDDEEHVRVALRRLCSAYGMNARTYASAGQLLDSLDGELPHCLILDVQMPGLGGLDAQAAIRTRGIHIPAIVITGRDDHEMRARSVALGVHAYLCKPIDAEILVGAINEAIGAHVAPSEREASARWQAAIGASAPSE
jgi:FixJ family two-component response regulator